MNKILLAWVGEADHRAAEGTGDELGPILHALKSSRFDRVFLLNNYPASRSKAYLKWLERRPSCPEAHLRDVKLKSPVDYEGIYKLCKAEIGRIQEKHPGEQLCLHLSPGTAAMQTVWVLLAYDRGNVQLVSTSKEEGFKEVELPFEMSVDFVPEALRRQDQRLQQLAEGLPPEAPEFEEIIHQDSAMAQVVTRARVVALRNVEVLIEGESGTGKELFARAIHNASPRSDGKFVAVNCGAIPETLVESTFFGYAKGAFTGAAKDTPGVLEQAHGGTVFLDEIGEMPLSAQVKLLRALQERKVIRVGAVDERAIDVRIIAATNRRLMQEVADGRFREDLFHRLAVAILSIPPVRDRGKDVELLADVLLKRINQQAEGEPGYTQKKLSGAARKRLMRERWPGNVRELQNTLLRASIWTQGETISAAEIDDAILTRDPATDSVLGQQIGNGFDLHDVMSRVAQHYLERALSETHGVKAQAAILLGLGNATTLTNWMEKHGIQRPRR